MMNKILFISIFLALFLETTSQVNRTRFTGNPVFPGWYADPEGVIFGKDFWIYPTWSGTFDKQTFFDAFSSPDLVHWTKHTHVLDTTSVKWAKKALWAPSVIGKDGKYFFFFGANNIQSDQESGGIGVAVADRPEGPFTDYLGKPLIDKIHNGAPTYRPVRVSRPQRAILPDIRGMGALQHCQVKK